MCLSNSIASYPSVLRSQGASLAHICLQGGKPALTELSGFCFNFDDTADYAVGRSQDCYMQTSYHTASYHTYRTREVFSNGRPRCLAALLPAKSMCCL